jgi:predicted esterase
MRSKYEKVEVDDLMGDCHVLEPQRHTKTVVWLHGIGKDCHRESRMFTMLQLPGVRYVCPNPPKMPITALDEKEERSWFDVFGEPITEAHEEDEMGVEDSARRIVDLLDAQCAEVGGAQNVVLAGFGQGGAMALHVAMRYPEQLAGVVSFSGYWLRALEEELEGRSTRDSATKYLLVHGKEDFAVPLAFAQQRYSTLKEKHVDPKNVDEIVNRDMGHFMSEECNLAMHAWLASTLRV